jgi:enoyl-CoA hydratase
VIRTERRGSVVIVTIDNPPVNALPVAGWFAFADALRDAGRDPATHAVIIAAEGRGFQAGVDIKELAADPTHRSLVEVNRGCAETFAAVYDCPVPVIAAVNGYCLGGGIGIAGNADILVASDDATFGVPEVDRGALGTATHLARLVPQHKVRAMFFTGEMVTRPTCSRSERASASCPAPTCSQPRSTSRTRSRRRARLSSAGPRSRSTASRRST